jgi:ABC-2 type transport system ATP-binding protein
VRDASLTAAAGEIVGLVGPNGAGKTTLLRIAARLVGADSGHVELGDASPGATRYFGGDRTLPPDVRVHTWRQLWRLDSDGRAGRRRIGALSRGMRQRLGLEVALARPALAALVLLDEPWEGLDPDAATWLSHALLDARSAGAAAIVSSHRIHDLAAVCDRCVFMGGGRLITEVHLDGRAGDRSLVLLDAFERARGVRT